MLPFWLPAMSLTGRFCGQHFSEENLYIWCQSGSKLEIAKEINRVAMLAARFKKHVRLIESIGLYCQLKKRNIYLIPLSG